jgi:hypothetical protein
MRTTFDLPDDLMKRAKIAAVKRGLFDQEEITHLNDVYRGR